MYGWRKQNLPFDSLPLSSSPSRAICSSPSADAAWARSSQLALLVMPVDPLAFQVGLLWLPWVVYTQCSRIHAANRMQGHTCCVHDHWAHMLPTNSICQKLLEHNSYCVAIRDVALIPTTIANATFTSFCLLNTKSAGCLDACQKSSSGPCCLLGTYSGFCLSQSTQQLKQPAAMSNARRRNATNMDTRGSRSEKTKERMSD